MSTKPPVDPKAMALLAALNELFNPDWTMEVGSEYIVYRLTIHLFGRKNPFVYHRSIKPQHIDEPFRTAKVWSDEVVDRYGREVLLKQKELPPVIGSEQTIADASPIGGTKRGLYTDTRAK